MHLDVPLVKLEQKAPAGSSRLELCKKGEFSEDGNYTFIGMGDTERDRLAEKLQETTLRDVTSKKKMRISTKTNKRKSLEH